MTLLRCITQVEVRNVDEPMSGISEGGRSWAFQPFQVLDSDSNKSRLNVPYESKDGVAGKIEQGYSVPIVGKKYELTIDVETDRRNKANANIVAMKLVA